MGAGKSTVGKRLAKRLELDFVDSDDAIAEACGLPAGEVFARYGEQDFRDGERRIISRLLDKGIRVIATGGGAFADEGTRSMLKEKAVTVWLDAPIEILAERTSGRDTRPLLNNADPRGTLERLMEAREPFYAQADIHVRSGNVPHRDVVEWIVSAVAHHLGGRA